MSRKVMAAIVAHAQVAALLSGKHFSVDDTLIKARACRKSFPTKVEGSPAGRQGRIRRGWW